MSECSGQWEDAMFYCDGLHPCVEHDCTIIRCACDPCRSQWDEMKRCICLEKPDSEEELCRR